MLKVAIVGASGYTGVELIRLLSNHPEVEITAVTSEQSAGKAISSVFPSLTKIFDKTLEPLDANVIAKKARLIANPGCYPTSAILALAPLLKNRLIAPETIVIDSKSGVSGAGRSATQDTHFPEVNEGFKAYKVAEHRHTPEIEQELSLLANSPVIVSFTPHLLPANRGLLSTVYASVKKDMDEDSIIGLYNKF